MPALGSFIVLLAFVLGAVAFATSIAGARRRQQSLVEGGVATFHAVTALMLVASTLIVYAFVIGDYRVKYVQHYSDAVQPMFYRLASYWGGLDGSLMFWVTLLAVFGSVALHVNRERQRQLIPYVVAVLAVIEMFFLFLMVVHNNPFDTFITKTPTDGQGLNPLLQNFYMAIHPPMLYLGFVGMSIPYAFGMAALITGHLDDSWLRAVRRWTMVAWMFLTFGLALGGLWAYEDLGWGGFWMWDPVENAGLLPWFTATAFLHSVMVQERRGMLKVWNSALVIVTFFLTIFGTFMTRSGVVQSVHAFGEDKQLAWMFTIFMIATLVISFGFLIYRLPLLRARHDLDSWISREAAFLVNNWVLLFSAFFVLFATMFPTLSEAFRHERLTVGPPFFNKWMAPVGVILLFLTGAGPLLAWRKSTISNLRMQFLWPSLGAIVTAAFVTWLGVPLWASGVCFAMSCFVIVTIIQECIRGARVRQEATGTDLFTAFVGLVARNRRRYAGYFIHVGFALAFLGFAGTGFKQEEDVTLAPGQQVTVPPYTVKYISSGITDDGAKQMLTARTEISRNGKVLGELFPARWYFRQHESEPTTMAGIRKSAADDLFVAFREFETDTQKANFKIIVNPLINWIWIGVGLMVFGTIIALLPEAAIVFATGVAPEGVVTSMLVVLLIGMGGVGLKAQHVQSPDTVVLTPHTPLEKSLQNDIICMCGTCGRERVGECTCDVSAAMRKEIAELSKQGMTHEQAINYFVTKYGSQEVLAQPIDRGFNRLAWLFPYAIGGIGIVTIGAVAARWSRRTPPAQTPSAVETPADKAALETRLDDELRDLD